MRRRLSLAIFGALCCALLVGCADKAPPASKGLVIFAPPSLLHTTTDLTAAYLRRDTTLGLLLNVAGAPQLVSMLERGATGDVLITDDREWMDYAIGKGLAGAPVAIATSRLVLAVARRPEVQEYLKSPLNLASPGTKVVLAGPEVPLGRYTRVLLARLKEVRGYGPDFADRVELNAVSMEQNEAAVLRKLSDSTADAAFLYQSAVAADTGGHLTTLALPVVTPVATWYAAIIPSGDTALARPLVEWLAGAQAQQILRRHGFGAPPDSAR